MEGRIVDIDETGTVLTYLYEEEITAASEDVSGHGRGVAVLTLFDDGSFLLETSTTVILDLG